nr:ATP synthase F0 subunit 8 [Punctum randolphii]
MPQLSPSSGLMIFIFISLILFMFMVNLSTVNNNQPKKMTSSLKSKKHMFFN